MKRLPFCSLIILFVLLLKILTKCTIRWRVLPQGSDLVSFLHWSTSPCTILLVAFLATLVSIEQTLMLELWTLLPAMARLALITIGSYIFRSPKLICARSKLILATSTSKYRKNCLRSTLRRWKKSRKWDLGLGVYKEFPENLLMKIYF